MKFVIKEWVEVEGRSLGGMITILVEGLKELVDRITGAEERLDSLESENDFTKNIPTRYLQRRKC